MASSERIREDGEEQSERQEDAVDDEGWQEEDGGADEEDGREDEEKGSDDETPVEAPDEDSSEDEEAEEDRDEVSPSASSSSDEDSEDEYREEEGEESDDEERADRSTGKEAESTRGMLEAVDKIGVKKGTGWSRPLQQPSGRTCDICGKEFKWPNLLRLHLQTHVNKCPDCGINCISYHALRTHISKEHKESIQCPKCDYAHKLPSQVRRHFEQNHVQGLPCPIGGCSAVVAFNRLRTHITKVHATAAAAEQRKGALPVRPNVAVAGSRDSLGGTIECEECGRVVESEEELEMHVQSAHGAGVFCPHPECRGVSGSERMRLVDLQTHIEEKHADDARLPHFHTQSGRSISIASETTLSEYAVSRSSHPTTTASETVGPTSSSVPSCPSTSRGARTRSVIYSIEPIEEGEEEEEPEETPSTSDGRCSRETRSMKRKGEERDGGMEEGKKKGRIDEDELDDDIRALEEQLQDETKRGNEVPAFSELGLICKECGKVYANTDSLRKHKARVHEKRYTESARKKIYACTEEDCDKAFTTPGALQDHTNWHNGVTAHVCENCGKSFTSRAYYARHLSKYHQISIKSLESIHEFVATANSKKAK